MRVCTQREQIAILLLSTADTPRVLAQFAYGHRGGNDCEHTSNRLVACNRRTMPRKIIRNILDAMTCLTPSPKKRKDEENDHEGGKTRSPRYTTLIAETEDDLRSVNEVEVWSGLFESRVFKQTIIIEWSNSAFRYLIHFWWNNNVNSNLISVSRHFSLNGY